MKLQSQPPSDCTCNSATYRTAPHLSCTPHLCSWSMDGVSPASPLLLYFPPSTVVLAVILSLFCSYYFIFHKLQNMTIEDLNFPNYS